MSDTLDYSRLTTEQNNEKSRSLDLLSTQEAVALMNAMDGEVAAAVSGQIPQIAAVIDCIVHSFRRGGRLIYCGAGTSGRLGVLDASECPPTFGVEPGMVVGVIAGGDFALRNAVEGAEDSAEAGVEDLKRLRFSSIDTLIAISTSGSAAYCCAACDYARSVGASTACLVCTKGSELAKHADIAIEAVVGAEVLTGSTRLRAGTATKMILNMLTTVSMTKIGKVYKNYMVDMVASNRKLHDRAIRIIMGAAECDRQTAETAITACGGNMKKAIVCVLTGCSPAEAERRLERQDGFVRKAVETQ